MISEAFSPARFEAGGAIAAAATWASVGAASVPPRFGLRTVSSRSGATTIPISPTTMKAVRQPYWAASRPPTRVPAAVPSGMPKAKPASARARWCGGK